MRLATIDIGTNSVLLLVAQPSPQNPGQLQPLLERSSITRLGQDVDRTRVLHPEAIQRTLSTLRDYAQLLSELRVQSLAVVATSATRDAGGAGGFMDEAQRILGVRPRVISGASEARLSFIGSLSGLQLLGPVAVQDIGGGSTEIVRGLSSSAGAIVEHAVSLDMGSVRLTERLLHSDPPDGQQLQAVRDEVRRQLSHVEPAAAELRWVGIAGTVTTLAAIATGSRDYQVERVHGSRLTCDAIEEMIKRLGAMTLSERMNVPGLQPKRADVIVAGALIASEVLRWGGASGMVVSDRGVRWGAAMELAAGVSPDSW
jgi:exopolyphosphatase / guanosine-5'-triphosphate,3'-diphosphate pyrophosphatase